MRAENESPAPAPAGHSFLRRLARRSMFLAALAAAFCAGFALARHKVRGDLCVVRASPSGIVSPADTTRIEVEFGETIDPETVGPGALRLVPCAEGSVRLEKQRILVLELAGKLKPANRYRIVVSPEIRGLNGEPASSEQIEFTTTPLDAIEAFQSDFKLHEYSEISIRFNAPVKPDELAGYLEVSGPNGTRISFAMAGSEPAETVMFRIEQPDCEELRVRVLEGLAGTEGPLPLARDFEASVVVSRALKLRSMEAAWNGSAPEIRVHMNESVHPSTAAGFVKIEPPVRFSCHYHYSGFSISGGFQPGGRYRVSLLPGLPAGDAGVLDKEASRTVWFPDVPESFGFSLPGCYMSQDGLLTIPLRSTNVNEINLKTWRLYASNVPEYVLRGSRTDLPELGTLIAQKKIDVRGPRNEETETLLHARDWVSEDPRGIFLLEARSPSCRWRCERKLVVVTDIGISARVSGSTLDLWVNSIKAATPVEGAEIRLYSSKRQIMGETISDALGMARIGLPEAAEGETPALIVARKGQDLSYLFFEGCGRPRKTGGSGGRPYLVKGYEALCFADRGVFRPGDDVRLSALVRGTDCSLPPPMPLEIRVTGPSGADFARLPVMSDPNGAIAAAVKVPMDAATGRYQVMLGLPGAGDAIGQASFAVAEYIPPTLEMKIEPPSCPVSAGGIARISVAVGNLFGAPASCLKVRGRARFTRSRFHDPAWDGFVFGAANAENASAVERQTETRTGADGNAVLDVPVPESAGAAVLWADVEIEAIDTGGRALVKSVSFPVYAAKSSLGLLLPPDPPQAGARFTVRTAAVGIGGSACDFDSPYLVTVDRVTWAYVLRKSGSGRLAYEWTRGKQRVSSQERRFAHGADDAGILVEEPGTYEISVECAGSSAASCILQVAGPGLQWVSENPEELAISLDRKQYRPGESARIRLTGPFQGRALVCIEKERVLSSRIVEMPAGEAEFTETVDEGWRPNVYVTATLIRPAAHEREWRPHLACGCAMLKIDDLDRRLELAVSHAAEARPGKPFEVRVAVRCGADAAAGASVIIAAVDEGVLDMTGHVTPDPASFFHGSRRLEIREFDMYRDLAPELSSFRLCAVSEPGGGDDCAAEISGFINPIQVRRVRTVALFAGPLQAGRDGVLTHVFAMPEFTGRLRVMAVAALGRCFGSFESRVGVSSPIVVKASWPRFMSPGDSANLPVTVWNRTGAEANIRLALSVDGPLEADESETDVRGIASGGERTVFLRVRAAGAGKASARVTACAGNETCTDSVELAVRPGAAFRRECESLVVEPGSVHSFGQAGGWIEGTARGSLVIGCTPAVELTGALGYLLDYPYGCLEQTTSRLVPLVYLRDLASLSGRGCVEQEDVEDLMKAGFDRLSLMRTRSGGLAMWPGGAEPEPWGSAFAADLLVEARKAGLAAPEGLLDGLLDYLSRSAGGWIEARDSDDKPRMQEEAAYAVYVLARAGRPGFAAMSRLEEMFRAGGGILPSASFMLAASMALSGQREAGLSLLCGTPRFAVSRPRGGSMDSPVREAALMLSVMLDLDPVNRLVPVLAGRIRERLELGRWGTTQENAFAIQALGKLARRLGPVSPGRVIVSLRDGSERLFDSSGGARLSGADAMSAVSVRVEGGSRVFAFRETSGVPADGAVVEEDSGLAARRTFLSADGTKAADPAKFTQGEIYRVRITLQAGCRLDNLVVADLLPAGLEIFRLDAGRPAEKGRSAAVILPVHAEARDDRLLLFCSIDAGRAAEYDYLVRAVTPGDFALPALDASCMYDPGIFSVNGKGRAAVGKADGN